MTSPDALAAGLRAHAQGLYCLEAAAELLIATSWLHRDDFTSQFAAVHPGIGSGQLMTVIDWPAAVAALGSSLACSGGEQRMLKITASIADGIPRRPPGHPHRPRRRQHRDAGHRDPSCRRKTAREQRILMIVFSSEKAANAASSSYQPASQAVFPSTSVTPSPDSTTATPLCWSQPSGMQPESGHEQRS